MKTPIQDIRTSMQDSVKQLSYAELTQCTTLHLAYCPYRRQNLCLVSFPSSCFLAASASIAFQSSFVSVPLQVTFARGRKALTAVTEHYLMSLVPQCGAAVTAVFRYLRPSPGLNVAKQPDFSTRHRTLPRYRFIHV